MSKAKFSAASLGLAALVVVGLACGAGKPLSSEGPGATVSPPPASANEVQPPSPAAQPDPLSLPEAAVPMHLGAVTLPDDADAIVSLFSRLPRVLVGRERTPRLDEAGPSRFTAAYGQLPEDGCTSVRVQAQDLSSGEFFPADWTADRFVAWWGLGADREVEGLGRDDDLFWVRWSTTCSSALVPRAVQSTPPPRSFPVSTLTWGKAGSRWVFSIVAGSLDGQDEMAAAFVDASG